MTNRIPGGSEPSRALQPTTHSALGSYDPNAAYVDAPEEAEEEGGLDIGRIVSAILRYKWLVLGIGIVGTAASVFATRFIKPTYSASATVYVTQGGQTGSGPIRADGVIRDNSWPQLVRSFAVIDPVVRTHRLYLWHPPADSIPFRGFDLAPRFQPGDYRIQVDATGQKYTLLRGKSVPIEHGAIGDSVGRSLGFRWVPAPGSITPETEVPFTVSVPRDVSAGLAAGLGVRVAQASALMVISLQDSNAERAALVVNAIVDQFLRVADGLKRDQLAAVTQDLTDQIRIADSAMRGAETALESYRVTTITQPRFEQQAPLPSGLQQTQPTVMSNYMAKRLELSNLEKDRLAIERLVRQGRETGAVPVDAYHTIPAVRAAPDLVTVLAEVSRTEVELRSLRNRYTDEYGGIKKLVADLGELTSRTIPLYAERLIGQLRTQEATLKAEIDSDSRELRQIPIRTHTEDRLARDAQSAVTLRQNLQNRLQEARLAELTATPDVRILDRAEIPGYPSSNTAPRIVLFGVAASLGLALALAILLDRIDKRFRYPDQVSQGLGLTILGAVPVIRKSRGAILTDAETAPIVEAFRSVRMNLAHSFNDGDPIMLTITSPMAGDGKSLISSNLAMSFAEAGYQTVLIDGDTRRGELYRVFGGDRRPGLLDHLDGDATIEQICRQTAAHPKLTLIPCGTRAARGPELLGSAAMTDLIRTLQSRYQVVLIDSPPLGAGIDPFVLSTVTGNVIIVLRAGETDRELAEAKIRLMDRLPTRVLGAVLNHIDVGKGSYKYYAYEYTTRKENEESTKPADRPVALPRA